MRLRACGIRSSPREVAAVQWLAELRLIPDLDGFGHDAAAARSKRVLRIKPCPGETGIRPAPNLDRNGMVNIVPRQLSKRNGNLILGSRLLG
jgi:hypothetical protein